MYSFDTLHKNPAKLYSQPDYQFWYRICRYQCIGRRRISVVHFISTAVAHWFAQVMLFFVGWFVLAYWMNPR